MPRKPKEKVTCQVCRLPKPYNEVMHAEIVRESIKELIRKEHPDWSEDGFICFPDLNAFRARYIREILSKEVSEVTSLEHQVAKSIEQQELLSRNLNEEFDTKTSFGDRLSDRMAEFGGSWRFIILFATVMVCWIGINTAMLLAKPFDPFPYILLNLVLSCLAAIQAPVIMMSQNRQEAKDRLRAEHDYRVNLKAELEIRNLHEKVDHLLVHQWQRLMEIQDVQMDLLAELRK
jgi:uncharacterized membrane protein